MDTFRALDDKPVNPIPAVIPIIKVDDESSDSELLSDIIEEPESFDSVLSQCETSPRICVALHDYAPDQPNQLGFAQGQLIKVFGKASANKGFVLAEIGGQKGLCPEDFISEVQPVAKQKSGKSQCGKLLICRTLLIFGQSSGFCLKWLPWPHKLIENY